MKTLLYTDGGCIGNYLENIEDRIMKAVVLDPNGKVLVQETKQGGSNNIAELWAIQLALEWANENGHDDLEIRTDSKNSLAWVAGRIGSKLNDRLAVLKLYHEIQILKQTIKLQLIWVARDYNVAGIYLEHLA